MIVVVFTTSILATGFMWPEQVILYNFAKGMKTWQAHKHDVADGNGSKHVNKQ